MTLTPDTGYEVGRIEVVDADGQRALYTPPAGTVTFTMPVLSGDPVNDPVNAGQEHRSARGFAPTATYSRIRKPSASHQRGRHGHGHPGLQAVTLTSAHEGYELASLSVTDSDGIPYERSMTRHAVRFTSRGRPRRRALQRGATGTVTGAADTIGSAGAPSARPWTAQADAALMARSMSCSEPQPQPGQAQALLDALGPSRDLTSQAERRPTSSVRQHHSGAHGPIHSRGRRDLNEHLGYAMQSLQAASNSITDAVAGVATCSAT